jgi:beta-N-acetylhexosaminidase
VHHDIAAAIADRTVTLIKDTQGNLPLDPERHHRLRLFALAGEPDFTGYTSTEFKDIAIEELTSAGFEVHPYRDFAEQKAAGRTELDFQTFLLEESDGFAERYDAAIVLANISDFASQGALRIKWSAPMAPEIPWYVTQVPTVFVSLNMPNHLIDVPMVKTAINAHVPTREAIRSVVEKITGRSPFLGSFNDNVFCDSFDTRR